MLVSLVNVQRLLTGANFAAVLAFELDTVDDQVSEKKEKVRSKKYAETLIALSIYKLYSQSVEEECCTVNV